MFPKLSETGGYELLLYQRGGGENGGFHVIKPPLCSVRQRDVCGKSKIYVRPVQRNIPLDSTDCEIPEAENEVCDITYYNQGEIAPPPPII